MQKLSAIDAISPAWDHTRKLLLEPPRWTLLLKIGLVAAFSQAGGCNSNSSRGMGGPMHTPGHLPGAILLGTFLLILSLVVLVVAFAFFYLGSRLQFVLFDLVLRRDTMIGPIWRRYGPATWRWIGLQILFFLVAAACLTPILIPAVIAFIHSMPSGGVDPSTHIGAFFGAILGFIGTIFLALLIIGLGVLLLHDFGLPSMALEGTPLSETVARIFRLLRAEPLDMLLYIVMKVVLRLGVAIGLGIATILGFLILAIPLGIAGGILYAALHHASTPAHVIMWIGIGVLALIFLVIALVVAFMLSGITGTFFQAYNLYFLGGRYPLLGEILQPTPLPPPVVYPPFDPIPPPDPALA